MRREPRRSRWLQRTAEPSRTPMGLTSVTVHYSPRAGTQATAAHGDPSAPGVLLRPQRHQSPGTRWRGLRITIVSLRFTPCVVREEELPLTVTVQLVDEHDNPLAVADRRVRVKLAEAMTATPADVATDSMGKAEFRLAFDLSKRWVGAAQVGRRTGSRRPICPISVRLTHRCRSPTAFCPTATSRPVTASRSYLSAVLCKLGPVRDAERRMGSVLAVPCHDGS